MKDETLPKLHYAYVYKPSAEKCKIPCYTFFKINVSTSILTHRSEGTGRGMCVDGLGVGREVEKAP